MGVEEETCGRASAGSQTHAERDVPTGIGDLVYSIMPYPGEAFQFGVDAARIASYKPGTIIAVTEGGTGSSKSFESGFNSVRSDCIFKASYGSPYGQPGRWEPGPWVTRTCEIP